MFRIFSDLSNFDFWHKKIKNHWEENIKELEKNISHKIKGNYTNLMSY